ncbi:MAG: response regulator transcription factor [Thermoguttaceae bacterium]
MEPVFTPKTRLSLLIVDHQTLFREGLVLLLRIYEEATAAAADYQTAVKTLQNFKPNVILLGLDTRESQCWSTAEAIGRDHADIPLLILDEAVRTRNIRRALGLGIRGYWTKHATLSQIADAARRLTTGESAFCPEVQRYLFNSRRGLRYHPAHTDNPLQKISPRETELLTLLAQGFTLRECSEKMRISINTVDNHKTRLMRKLGVHKSVELARLALREGLISEE